MKDKKVESGKNENKKKQIGKKLSCENLSKASGGIDPHVGTNICVAYGGPALSDQKITQPINTPCNDGFNFSGSNNNENKNKNTNDKRD